MKVKLMAMLLAAGAMLGAWAETITIGSGTANDIYLPTYSIYNYSLTQQIYTFDEIGGSCTIGSIAFKNVGTETRTRTLDIYLVHTDKDSFSNIEDWIAVTADDKVFSGDVTFTAGEWTTIAFDVPFSYNGVENLAVIVDDNSGHWEDGMRCLAFEAQGMAIRVYSDDDDYNPFSPGEISGNTTIVDVKNQIQLGVSGFKPVGLGVTEFDGLSYSVDEGGVLTVEVCGGSTRMPARATVYLQYQTAAAADLDLKTATVGGVTPKGGLKFPLTLTWDAGDTEPKTIKIPVKADNTVEGYETFLLQVAEPVGMTLGGKEIAQVIICDTNKKTLKPSVSPYKPKKNESVATNTVEVSASPSDLGFAAGSGEYTAGTKLTLVAEARPGCTFVGWEKGGEIVSDKPKCQIVVSEDCSYTARFVMTDYITALALSADGGKATGSGYCPAGKKVTLKASANKNNRFIGWFVQPPKNVLKLEPAEPAFDRDNLVLVAETPSLVIDRTTKPGKSTAASTVLTDVTVSTVFFALFEQDPLVSVIPVDAEGVNYDAGKVTGAGRYAPGKKVTLKATAGKGFVFSGFYNAAGRLVDTTRSASYSFEMGEGDMPLTAMFVSPDADKGSIEAAITLSDYDDPTELDVDEPAWLNTYCGVAVDWPIEATALSATTVKASGLPSGVKLVQDKATGAWSLTGAPTAASKKKDKDSDDLIPFQVKLTVTTAGKASKTYGLLWTVAPLPDWVVGTFDGNVCGKQLIRISAEPESELLGLFSLTVGANGKISGKCQMDGKSWTLSAASFDSAEIPYRMLLLPEFYATVIAKSGKEVVTNIVGITNSDVCDPEGKETSRGYLRGHSEDYRVVEFIAVQNLWKNEPWKTAMKDFAKATPTYTEEFKGGKVTLKFAASGAVTAKGEFLVFDEKKQKEVTYSASCSTVLIPYGSCDIESDAEMSGVVLVVFPPNEKKYFYGWSGEIHIGREPVYE